MSRYDGFSPRILYGLSARECERKLAAISPESALPKDRIRVVTEELTQIQFLADRELLGKLEKLKGLLAHRNFEGSYAVLFRTLADMALKKLVPAQNEAPQLKGKPEYPETAVTRDQSQTQDRAQNQARAQNQNRPNNSPISTPIQTKASRYLAGNIKAAVYRRDEGKCTYRDRKTNHRTRNREACDDRLALRGPRWGFPVTARPGVSRPHSPTDHSEISRAFVGILPSHHPANILGIEPERLLAKHATPIRE